MNSSGTSSHASSSKKGHIGLYQDLANHGCFVCARVFNELVALRQQQLQLILAEYTKVAIWLLSSLFAQQYYWHYFLRQQAQL